MLLTPPRPVLANRALCHEPHATLPVPLDSALHALADAWNGDHETPTTLTCELEHDHDGAHAALLQAWSSSAACIIGELWVHWGPDQTVAMLAFQEPCMAFTVVSHPEPILTAGGFAVGEQAAPYEDEITCVLFAAHPGRCSFDLPHAV